MVVVLTAALAIRYYSGLPPTQIERQLSEQWRQRSSSFLCGTDTTTTESPSNDNDENPPRTDRKMTTTSTASNNNNNDVHGTVRQQWIDAVFGKDFDNATSSSSVAASSSSSPAATTSPDSPQQATTTTNTGLVRGVGMAQVGPYTAQRTSIRPLTTNNTEKVGMTLANIALGVYVRAVVPDSEAYCAGILPESILVSINNKLGMLAEPTKSALERLWQYEGLFCSTYNTKDTTSPKQQQSISTSTSSCRRSIPLQMTFYHNGIGLYTVTLGVCSSGNRPFGISWAPCGNFPLVQRSYAHAANAGIRRGCLLGSVGGTSIRSMDYQVAAHVVNQWQQEGKQQGEEGGDDNEDTKPQQQQEPLHVTLLYTPSASRTSGFERDGGTTATTTANGPSTTTTTTTSSNATTATSPRGARQSRTAVSTHDGIEVRVQPLAYSISTLFQHQQQQPSNGSSPGDKRSGNDDGGCSISELAAQVAAGKVMAPSGFEKDVMTTTTTTSTTTDLQTPSVVATATQPPPTTTTTIRRTALDRVFPPPPLPNNDNKNNNTSSSLMAGWNSNPWEALAYCLLFQEQSFHKLVATPLKGDAVAQVMERTALLVNNNNQDYEDSSSSLLLLPYALHVVCTCVSQPLMAKLLDEAEETNDNALQQTLYYLLRSYIATLEDDSGSRRSDSSSTRKDVMALEILQAAQLELVDRMQQDKRVVTVPITAPIPGRLEQSPFIETNGGGDKTGSIDDSGGTQALVSSLSLDAGSNTTAKSSGGGGGGGGALTKKKSVFRVFRKKSSKSLSPNKSRSVASKSKSMSPPSSPPAKTTTTATSSIKATNMIPSSPPKTKSTRMSTLFDNMTKFLIELDSMCVTVERSLLKSISQKIADWALQPWSLSKHKALLAVTEGMRDALTRSENLLPIINPIEGSEILTTVDPRECYILPSAHFPLLLTFNVSSNETTAIAKKQMTTRSPIMEQERLYRTRVEIVSLRGSKASPVKVRRAGSKTDAVSTSSRVFFVQGAVSGVIRESGRSTRHDSETSLHSWEKGSLLTFDTRSSWGSPKTLSLRLSSVNLGDDGLAKMTHADVERGTLHYSEQVGFCWVDLRPMWARIDVAKSNFATVMCHAQFCSLDSLQSFDQHGDLSSEATSECFEIELRITTEMLPFNEAASGFQSRRRMLLYKHDDDLRQELFAIEFIKACDALLKASGLDLDLLTFRCIPVGEKQGFIEWVPGSVPLSDICKPADDVPLSRNVSEASDADDKLQQSQNSLSETARAGLTKYQSLYRLEPLQRTAERGVVSNNPIQDFLRSVAYDPDAPYMIRKDVMGTYVKSCAGYCVVTYVLGVGDRHLDNLLLHQTGHFFHCDFSFILGEDPKKYLPMRITEDMVFGMGGKESDNYAMFLSLVGAAFLALRRHENVRVLLSLVRLMVGNNDLSIHDNPDEALSQMRERLCLTLSDTEAVSYIEELIETSMSSKLWKAVDAIHSLGKRF